MKKKNFIFLSFIILCLLSCNRQNPYRVSKNRVGCLTNETKMYELESIFKNDSIVPVLNEGFLGNHSGYEQEGDDTYLIYEKISGKHLLTITAEKPSDSLSHILCVAICDGRYTTEKGIGLQTNFQELDAKTYIRKIETTFNYVTLHLDAIGATMTLSKKDLKIPILDLKPIQKQQIPALAKPKSFVVWFEKTSKIVNEKNK